jgi:hypothetical protein
MIMKTEAATPAHLSVEANEKARCNPKQRCVLRCDSEGIRLAPQKTATDMPVRLAMKCLQAALHQANSFVKVSLLLRENAHSKKTTSIR